MLAGATIAVVVASAGAAPIIGGVPDDGDPAVVQVEIDGGTCTGALIAPEVVLTAGHCLAGAAGAPPLGTVRVGPGDGVFTEAATIVAAVVDRGWSVTGDGPDLALLRLDAALSPAPLGYRRADVVALDAVRLVGYGRTGDGPAGRKHEAVAPVALAAAWLDAGGDGVAPCTGDSGGPALADLDGAGEVIVAVDSAGDAACAAASRMWRVDPVAAWIDEVVAAWSGPCAADGACVAAGCDGHVDPDCDPCGLDGACVAGCPAIDLDCPVGGLAGDACDGDGDCEGRRCAPAPEDPRRGFCSATCAPAAGGADCPAPLDACVDGTCGFAGGTPGVIGAPCASAADCRSGLCDRGGGVCAEPCGPGGACPAGFACAPVGAGEACTVPGTGCCAAGGDGRAALAPALLVALALLRRPRRRGRAQVDAQRLG